MLTFFSAIARRARYGWSHNLGLRLSVGLSLTLLLIMGILSGTLLFHQHRMLRQAAENQTRAIARTFGAVGSAAVLDNLYRLQESMQLYMNTDSLLDIDIVDRDDMIVASKHPSRIGNVLSDRAWHDATESRREYVADTRSTDGRHALLIVEPLFDRGNLAAWVRMVVSLDDLEREATATFWGLVVVSLGIMAAGVYAIQHGLRKASAALRGVIETLHSAQLPIVTPEQASTAVIPVPTSPAPRGDFERLVRAATGAAAALRGQSQALQELARSLEDKVDARTAQLEEARLRAVRMMEELRESESRLRSLVENAADAILLTDTEWRIESVNPAACALFGYGVTELRERRIQDILWYERQETLGGAPPRQTARAEAKGRRQDGTGFDAEISISAMTLAGRPHYTIIVRDVTDRHHMEQMRRRSAERLQRLAEERAHLYHDLHNSLLQSLSAVSIGLETSKLLLAQAPDRAPRQLDWTVSHLQRVIREARDFLTRLEPRAGHHASLVQALQALVQANESWPCPPFQLDIDPDVASYLTIEQEIHLLAIVQEAVGNVVRHAHARSGRISLGSREKSIRLEIVDDGVGFTTVDIERSGPGLTTMATHARALQGRFTVDSAPGEGTSILVVAPLSQASPVVGAPLLGNDHSASSLRSLAEAPPQSRDPDLES